jgi:hypothetical protein
MVSLFVVAPFSMLLALWSVLIMTSSEVVEAVVLSCATWGIPSGVRKRADEEACVAVPCSLPEIHDSNALAGLEVTLQELCAGVGVYVRVL